MVDTFIEQIDTAYTRLSIVMTIVRKLVEALKSLSRRDAALRIQAELGAPYQGVAFTLLSNQEPHDKQMRKLMDIHLGL